MTASPLKILFQKIFERSPPTSPTTTSLTVHFSDNSIFRQTTYPKFKCYLFLQQLNSSIKFTSPTNQFSDYIITSFVLKTKRTKLNFTCSANKKRLRNSSPWRMWPNFWVPSKVIFIQAGSLYGAIIVWLNSQIEALETHRNAYFRTYFSRGFALILKLV